jgi:hypothetical protein
LPKGNHSEEWLCKRGFELKPRRIWRAGFAQLTRDGEWAHGERPTQATALEVKLGFVEHDQNVARNAGEFMHELLEARTFTAECG